MGEPNTDAEETARSFAMLLGGFDNAGRPRETANGSRPANDVAVLERAFGATILDFGWLEARASTSRPARVLVRFARRTGQWSAALSLATVFRVRRFDVVYVSGEDVGVVTCALSRLLPGRPPAFILRVERPRYGRTRLRRFVHRHVFRFASKHIAVAICRTSAHAAQLRAETALAADHVLTLGQEIDTVFFDPATEEAVPRPVDGPFIVSAGLERRDYATLIEAVAGLQVTLVIAASSPWSKDRFDTDRQLPANVIVDSFDRGEMRELYRHASLVVLSVLPTDRACGMNVIGEAWSMGRPVVASATSGMSEYITSGDTGLLVPPRDADALRRAIASVLDSDELARRLGTRGRAFVRENLSLDSFRDAVTRAIELSRR